MLADFADRAAFPVHVHINQSKLGSTRNFEKAIRLGTKRDPANIDVAGINAKMSEPAVTSVATRVPVPVRADAEGFKTAVR